MFKLLKYLRGYEAVSVLAPFFKLLEAFCELLVPIIMAKIIDIGIADGNTPYIWKMGGVLLILALLGLITSLTAQYFSSKAAAGFGTALRSATFKHINSFSFAEIDKIGIPSLITRMTNDITQAQTGVNMFLRLFMRAPFIVLGSLIASFIIDVKLGFIFLTASPLIGLVIYFIMRGTLPIYKQIQGKVDEVSLITRENLAGARVIRAFSKQDEEVERFDNSTDKLCDYQIKASRISALNNPLIYVIVNYAIIAILYFGAGFVKSGVLSQGEIIALINYLTQTSIALVAVSVLIVSLTKASASAQRINEVLNTKNTIVGSNVLPGNNDTAVAVEFNNVCFRFNDSSGNALNYISFTANKGERIGIIGGTGSGKTTLVNLIPRFYDISSGSIKVEGTDVKDYPLQALRQKLGLVMQKAVLFKGTVRENIHWGNENASDSEIENALEIAQAKEFVEEKGGLDNLINQGGNNLSGGQKQRLSIARALVRKPEILILDDSTSALDYFTESVLRKKIAKNTSGTTVFWVSQRASTVKNCDKIIVLDNGETVGIGKHKDLLNSCQIYREICMSQMSVGEERL